MPGSRWRSQQMWEPMTDYEAMEHVPKLSASGLGFGAYAKQHGLSRQALSEAVKRVNPEFHARHVEQFGSGDPQRRGPKFETSAKGVLARRGYLVVKQYASKSAFDMLAVGDGKPVLMVQCKVDGKLVFGEWNALYDLAVAHGCWPVLAVKPPDGAKGALWFKLAGRKETKGLRSEGMLIPFDPRDPTQDSLLAPPLAAAV